MFAGSLSKVEMGFAERTIISMVKVPYGDYRDWDEIKTWAREIAQELNRVPTPVAEPIAV